MATPKANNSSFARRKAFAIKHQEAEPLTRRDLQHDFLRHVFASQERVFTDPTLSSTQGNDSPSTATFRDLYVHALMSSPRCSKALREKMVETPEFATDFAKISLLANVGRVNTTMTFLPEMRTALRTYHPVPSLQKADANLQDAPRIKNILKACSLKNEATTSMPVTPMELCTRAATGIVPSTSIVNLLFVLSNHFTAVARQHFGCPDVDFLDLFLPVKLSSLSRARAFLWLAFHYHEAPTANPFAGPHARQRPGLVPEFVPLTDEEFELENVDPEDERDYAAKMTKLRLEFLAKNCPSQRRSVLAKRERSDPDSSPEDGNVRDADLLGRPTQRRKSDHSKSFKLPRTLSESSAPRASNRQHNIVHRSILQQAWHVVTTVDAFFDSDEEDMDESARHAYTMRLQVLDDFHQDINTSIRSRQWRRASAS
ncbi:hypothetical protein EDB86DRAFT_3072540 [Lactarius hatsudake]|nr:hypothetical protein EDB86DRAFT_3072540 [Lactarius hatsudake]